MAEIAKAKPALQSSFPGQRAITNALTPETAIRFGGRLAVVAVLSSIMRSRAAPYGNQDMYWFRTLEGKGAGTWTWMDTIGSPPSGNGATENDSCLV